MENGGNMTLGEMVVDWAKENGGYVEVPSGDNPVGERNRDSVKIKVESNKAADVLNSILQRFADKSICVVGTSCCGKTSFARYIGNCVCMEEAMCYLFSEQELQQVMQSPWTTEIGETMDRLVNSKIKTQPGFPIFGTVVMDSDLVVYLNISNGMLVARCEEQGISFEDASLMKEKIERDLIGLENVIEICY
ncbi:hypothetical protein [uncultured Robinsoniella sp.]|uniref:hypothetical protein n=1 Tax=uncultured Robinsoniella sp. TaxID=904190 RepID=UPI00374ED467